MLALNPQQVAESIPAVGFFALIMLYPQETGKGGSALSQEHAEVSLFYCLGTESNSWNGCSLIL